MKIAIQGMGVAGPALAFWLYNFGHEPVLIEKAPTPRKGGYLIDCWGVGYDLVEKMGILPDLLKNGYHIKDVFWVNSLGKISASFDPNALRKISKNRFVSIERSELARAILALLKGKVKMQFDDTIVKLKQHKEKVDVELKSGARESFDLVVGADGLHSQIREQVFGPMHQFEKKLGLRIAAFEIEGYQPRDELTAVLHTEPGRQICRISKRDNKTLFLLAMRDRLAGSELPQTELQKKAELMKVFYGMKWEAPKILSALNSIKHIYYDSVSQICMNTWCKNRVALIGDAGAAVSLLSGEGSGLGMLEAYVLANEIAKSPDNLFKSFAQYEKKLIPLIKQKQKAALKAASTFVPNTYLGILARNIVTRILPGEWAARLGLSLKCEAALIAYANEKPFKDI